MSTIAFRPDCLAIATDSNETVWVRSDPHDLGSLAASFAELARRPEYKDRVLHPLRSFTDSHGDERLVELWGPAWRTGTRDGTPDTSLSTVSVEVWHDNEPTFGFGPKSAEVSPADFTHLADLRVAVPCEDKRPEDICNAALNQAFYHSQNLDHGWHPRGARSSSVGDVFVVVLPSGRYTYRVASSGFEKATFKG